MNKIIDTKEIGNIVLNAIEVYSDTTFERAFANSKDGFKLSHRRLLYSLINVGGEKPGGKTVKTSRVIGECLPIHPHGDASLYGTLIKMGQPFTYSYILVDPNGNFGTHSEPNSYAAMRYTETKGTDFSYDVIFKDYNEKIVDFKPAEDVSKVEPIWLSTRLPLILIEGTEGIGEAFISSIPPHNLSEIVNICIKYIKNPNISNEELVDGLFPDFASGGTIVNGAEVERYYKYGEQCSLKLKGELEIDRDNYCITVTEFPMGTYYKRFKEEMLDLASKNNYHLARISNIIDNKSKKFKDFYEAKIYCNKDANLYEIANIALNKTSLKITRKLFFKLFDNGIIKNVNVKNIVEEWYHMRSTYIQKEINYKKNELEVELHILQGLLQVYDYTDDIIKIVKASLSKEDAIVKVMNHVKGLSKIQAKYICEMQLHKLSRVSKEEIKNNIESNLKKIEDLYNLLSRIPNIIIDQLLELEKKYRRPRRTKVLMNEEDSKEDLNLSNKVLLYARNGYLLHDIDSFLNSKNLINGLLSIKIDGVNLKEIIGYDFLKREIIGFGIFYSNGDYQFYGKDKITSLNHWLEIESKPERYVKKVIPYYSENDQLVILSDQMKIRRVKISEMTNKASNMNISNAILLKSNFVGSVMISNELNEYLLIPIDLTEENEDSEVPILNMKASGVNTSFREENQILMCKINTDETHLALYYFDETNLQGYMRIILTTSLLYNSRTNKLKMFDTKTNYKLTGISPVKLPNKLQDYNTVLLSKNTILKFNSRNLKFINEYRKISMKSLGSIQFNI